MLIWQAPDLTVGTVHGWIYTNERQILDDFTAFGQQVAGYVCFSEVRFSSAFYRQNLAFPWNFPPGDYVIFAISTSSLSIFMNWPIF